MKLFYIFLSIFTINSAIFGQSVIKKDISIGDHFGGGIVFYVDPSGQHGLISAPTDLQDYACWGVNGWTYANFMNEGNLNTKKIVTFSKTKKWYSWEAIPAACMCDSLILGGYDDWYLPSINELKGMYDKQEIIGNFIAGDYCSSTESSRTNCWSVHFKPHKRIVFHYDKLYNKYNVRCIRKF